MATGKARKSAPASAKAKKTGLLDVAILVLRETGQPMNTKEMVDAVLAKGLWKAERLAARPVGPGIYRFEARLDGAPWVFGNPFYLR